MGRSRDDRALCHDVPMARPRDQAARRAQLIEAATQAVISRGAANARLRDVAAEAGLTPASVLYYYPDLSELLVAVFERGTQTYIVHRRESVEAAQGAWPRLEACIRSGVPFPGEAEMTSRLLYELLPVSFRNEVANAQQRRFVADQSALYAQILEEGHHSGEFDLVDDAAVLARGFVALEDGYGIEVLSEASTAEHVYDVLVRHARLVTRAEERSSAR
jgi:AcrR family transcriptional regulator